MNFFGNNKDKKISPEERKAKSHSFIKPLGIDYNENLPCVESSSEVKLKDIDTICTRAIACLISTQLACDINAKYDYEESKTIFSNLLKKFGVENNLLDIEKRLFENQYSERDVINVSWSYECYWALVWALGFINDDEFKIPNNICDCEKAIKLVCDCNTFDEFKSKTKIRDIEEILDMLDLYYRYHWACVEKQVNPEANIGDLDPGVVMERRKGLEWLISDVEDWNKISLDT